MKAVNYLLMLAGFYLLVSCGDGKVSDRVIEDTGNALLTLGGTAPDQAAYKAAYLNRLPLNTDLWESAI